MTTEAQKKARDKYNKEHYKVVNFKVNRETKKDILEHLEAQPNKQGYIKELIKQDMRTKKE